MRGGRFRLVISSPNSISSQKNYNSGGPLETAKEAPHIQIYHDAAHARKIQLSLR
jgi:hypothetical protein